MSDFCFGSVPTCLPNVRFLTLPLEVSLHRLIHVLLPLLSVSTLLGWIGVFDRKWCSTILTHIDCDSSTPHLPWPCPPSFHIVVLSFGTIHVSLFINQSNVLGRSTSQNSKHTYVCKYFSINCSIYLAISSNSLLLLLFQITDIECCKSCKKNEENWTDRENERGEKEKKKEKSRVRWRTTRPQWWSFQE